GVLLRRPLTAAAVAAQLRRIMTPSFHFPTTPPTLPPHTSGIRLATRARGADARCLQLRPFPRALRQRSPADGGSAVADAVRGLALSRGGPLLGGAGRAGAAAPACRGARDARRHWPPALVAARARAFP